MPNDYSKPYPSAIRYGISCLWISVGLVVLLTVASLVGIWEIPSDGVSLATNVVTACLLILVAVKVGAGRGWARWLYAVLYLLGSVFFVLAALLAPEVFVALPTALKVSGVVQFLLQGVALVLIFTHASRSWFREKKAAN